MENPSVDRVEFHASGIVAAGTTDINTTGINARGMMDITWYAILGTITAGAVTSLKIEDSADNSSFAANANVTAVTVADTDDDSIKSIRMPREAMKAGRPYVRCVVDRATQNCELDGMVAVGRKMTT